jgi:hypothetical protein
MKENLFVHPACFPFKFSSKYNKGDLLENLLSGPCFLTTLKQCQEPTSPNVPSNPDQVSQEPYPAQYVQQGPTFWYIQKQAGE